MGDKCHSAHDSSWLIKDRFSVFFIHLHLSSCSSPLLSSSLPCCHLCVSKVFSRYRIRLGSDPGHKTSSPPLSLSLSFSPPLSFCIMEYHCGAEIPSLTSPRLHNENKWAGSKYAGCVLFAALYQSAYRLSSKIKMDCVAEKSPNNAGQCFIYPKQNFKGHFKRFNTYIHSH